MEGASTKAVADAHIQSWFSPSEQKIDMSRSRFLDWLSGKHKLTFAEPPDPSIVIVDMHWNERKSLSCTCIKCVA